jgi:hypothetical protein
MIEKLTSVVGELKGHPALMAVVLLQLATLCMVYLVASANAERSSERELALIEACKDRP